MADKVDIALSGASSAIRGQIVPTDSGGVKAPKNIIPNVTAARTIYYKYRSEHLKRIELYSRIEGLIAGNPPYNPIALEKAGLSHIANFNNLDGRSLYERGALAYWNLLNEAETLCKFTIEGVKDAHVIEWQDSMARNWDKVIRKWRSFETQVNTLSGQLIKFGISPVVWPDERDWRWRAVELSRFFVTDQALADVDQLTAVCIESVFTVQYLYEVYEEFKDKKAESPWDIDELGRLLLYRANTHAKTDYQILDMMDLQRRLQNGDLGYTAIFSDQIRLVSLLYKEYEGGISHYIFDRTFTHHNFLFKADRQYKNMDEALVIFTASPGEFTIHSNRGLGHKIFAGCQAMMQLDCSIVDAARWSSTPLIKSLATGTKDMQAIKFTPGVPTNIGTAEFVENTIGANIAQLISASNYMMQKLQYNTANSGDDPGTPDRNVGSISPTEARMKTFKEFSVLKHNVAFFYSRFDCVIRNMVIKMLNSKKGFPGYEYAKEWKERCLDDGVPEQIFSMGKTDVEGMPRHLTVKATRVAGDGSTLARIMGLEILGPIAGGFSAEGIKSYQKQMVMAVMGHDYVNDFLGDTEPDESSGGASLAGVENAIMKAGESPVFSPDNEQRSHIATHFALANHMIQALQQQQTDAVSADKIFNTLIPHLGEHIEYESKNPLEQQFMQSLVKPWKQVQEFAKMNRQAAGKAMQAEIEKRQQSQAQDQQVMTDAQRKDFVAQQDAKRADVKVQEQVNRAKDANVTRGEVMKDKVVRDAEVKRLKVQLDAEAKKNDPGKPDLSNLPESAVRQDLSNINGSTPAPFDIEKTPPNA